MSPTNNNNKKSQKGNGAANGQGKCDPIDIKGSTGKRKDWERLLELTMKKKEGVINVRKVCYSKLAEMKHKFSSKLSENGFKAVVADLEENIQSLDPVEKELEISLLL